MISGFSPTHHKYPFCEDNAPRRKSLRLINQYVKLQNEKTQKIEDENRIEKLRKTSHRRQTKNCNQQASENMAKFLCDDLTLDLQISRKDSLFPVYECEIEESISISVGQGVDMPSSCFVSHSMHEGMRWSGTQILGVAPSSTLKCWKMKSVSAFLKPAVYVFGKVFTDGTKYVTYKGIGEPFRFEPSNTHPYDIDIEGDKIEDDRAFYYDQQNDGSCGRFQVASCYNYAVYAVLNTSTEYPKVEATYSDGDSWKLCIVN